MSKNIDQQLEHLVAETDALEREATEPVVKPAKAPQKRDRAAVSLGLLAVLLCMVGGIVAIFTVGFQDAAVYAMPADKLVSRAGELTGRKVRVEGELVPGTLVKRDSPCEYKFTMHAADVPLQVRYGQCVIPDTFRDRPEGGVQVTVEGTLNKEGTFDATLVMAKCASKYDPATHSMKNAEDGTCKKGDECAEGAY